MIAAPASLDEIFVVDLGDEPAGRDGVDAHALEGELDRQRLGDLHHAGLGGGVGDRALGDAEAEHRGDVDDRALLLGGQHAARGLLRPEEHRVEIGREHAAPFLRRHLGGAAAVRDAGIVDQDGDGAESLFGGVEGARHGGAVGDVGFDRDGLAACCLDLFFERLQPVGAPRHQRDRGAIVGQRLGELRAEPARGAGHQRHAAFQVEHVGGFHVKRSIHTPRNDME